MQTVHWYCAIDTLEHVRDYRPRRVDLRPVHSANRGGISHWDDVSRIGDEAQANVQIKAPPDGGLIPQKVVQSVAGEY